jgi:hypothetical protein
MLPEKPRGSTLNAGVSDQAKRPLYIAIAMSARETKAALKFSAVAPIDKG